MAENENGAERSEDATSKRQEKAREEGQVARSRELNTTLVLLAGAWGLLSYGPGISLALANLMRFNFSFPRTAAFDEKQAVAHFYYSINTIAEALLPFLGVLTVAALAGPIVMGGWLFSASALVPKFSRMNPFTGIKRMFSLTALVELVKSIAKFVVLSGIAYIIINSLKSRLFALGTQPLHSALADALNMSGWAILGVSSGMILIAILDVPYQLFDHNNKLKMTKQEVKEEMKDSEGRPEVKGRIRQLQREMARRRMMEAVPSADVIVTNPEHFSVALRYDGGSGGAPIVVAKGTDQIAMKIREIARAHNITQLPAPTLARAIYYTTEIDREIPAPLYLAVAQVLAYVFQLKNWRAGQGRKPQAPDELPVPTELVFDQKGQRIKA